MMTSIENLTHRCGGLAIGVALLIAGVAPTATAQAARPSATAANQASANDDLVRLVQAHIDDSIIIDVIEKAGGRYDASVEAIVRLKSLGASDRVISVLRGIGSGTAVRTTSPTTRVRTDEPSDVVIPDGTEVRLQLVERVSSATARVGEKIRLEVAEDVKVGDRIVIAQGAPASGTVTVAEPRKSFGRRGKLDFTIDSVKTVDDQPVRLRVTKRAEGGERYLATGVVTYFTLVGGVFVKGKDVEVDTGTQYVIYIDGDRRLGGSSLAAAR